MQREPVVLRRLGPNRVSYLMCALTAMNGASTLRSKGAICQYRFRMIKATLRSETPATVVEETLEMLVREAAKADVQGWASVR